MFPNMKKGQEISNDGGFNFLKKTNKIFLISALTSKNGRTKNLLLRLPDLYKSYNA